MKKKNKKLSRIQEYKKIQKIIKQAFNNTAEYAKRDIEKNTQITI